MSTRLNDDELAKLLPEHRAHCQNCDWQGHVDDLDPCGDLWERTTEGDTVWAGDCPECGAMCFTVSEMERQQSADRIKAEHTELRAALANLREQVRAHLRFNVKKHYSLMIADAAAAAILANGAAMNSKQAAAGIEGGPFPVPKDDPMRDANERRAFIEEQEDSQ